MVDRCGTVWTCACTSQPSVRVEFGHMRTCLGDCAPGEDGALHVKAGREGDTAHPLAKVKGIVAKKLKGLGLEHRPHIATTGEEEGAVRPRNPPPSAGLRGVFLPPEARDPELSDGHELSRVADSAVPAGARTRRTSQQGCISVDAARPDAPGNRVVSHIAPLGGRCQAGHLRVNCHKIGSSNVREHLRLEVRERIAHNLDGRDHRRRCCG